MLSKLKIDQFQSIKEADLDMGRFTVIVGQSSTGKSATCRALKSLIRNDGHYSFVSRGSSSYSVKGRFENLTVAIERGKSHSTYYLLNGTERKFDKSGRSVPKEVSDVLNMTEVEGIDLHLTTQFDSPLLLNEASTVPAKVLGSFSHAGKLYSASELALKKRTQISSELKAYTEQLDTILTVLESKVDSSLSVNNIDVMLNRLYSIKELFTKVSKLELLISSLESTATKVIQLKNRAKELTNAVEFYQALNEKLTEISSLTSKIHSIILNASDLRTMKNVLSNLVDSIESDEALMVEYKKYAEVCPTCGQVIGESCSD